MIVNLVVPDLHGLKLAVSLENRPMIGETILFSPGCHLVIVDVAHNANGSSVFYCAPEIHNDPNWRDDIQSSIVSEF